MNEQPLPVPTATVVNKQDGIHVEVYWSGDLDRPYVGGWIFASHEELTASRLCAAINAGRVYKNIRVVKDIHGKTYVQAEQTQFFHKRHMKKSLTAVGF